MTDVVMGALSHAGLENDLSGESKISVLNKKPNKKQSSINHTSVNKTKCAIRSVNRLWK